eukprot:SAG11_NODE_17967_length_503_cov_37.668317_2_plen_28_part_01
MVRACPLKGKTSRTHLVIEDSNSSSTEI